ncbi:MAG TPA: GrpB family protein [Microlunatus sp.]|nr:GrpB family protein [Microlunatus sp.]
MVTHPLWRPYADAANAERQAHRVGRRQVAPGQLQPYRERWTSDYIELRALISSRLGDLMLSIRHIGSTAVPGLSAKPVIDIDLTVPEVEDDESYVPRLQQAGFELSFRDRLGGDPHRQLTYAAPNANLHVWGPRAIEPQRHRLFTRWLSEHPTDRDLYASAKREAVRTEGPSGYNDLKAAVVYDIYERAFLADQTHHHEPQPRRTSAVMGWTMGQRS